MTGDGAPNFMRLASGEAAPRRAAFLDRDGVLNVDSGYVFRPEDFVWRPGAVASVKWLNDRGVFVFVVTNQSGVARGLYEEEDVQRLHVHVQALLRREGARIDDFRYCPHHPEATRAVYRVRCQCRKPRSGMIEDLLRTWRLDPAHCRLFGDKDSDLIAGRGAGVASEPVTDDRPLIEIVEAAFRGLTA
jgi:D-glycero-D-manno-heptose 1,7-bisphosphate phosphatase